MKSTGIVRKVDELGRIVLPMELRRVLDINGNDSVEIFCEDGYIILRKYSPGCVFCKETRDLIERKGIKICKKCIKDIR